MPSSCGTSAGKKRSAHFRCPLLQVEHTTGIICVGMEGEDLDRLQLPLMVPPRENDEVSSVVRVSCVVSDRAACAHLELSLMGPPCKNDEGSSALRVQCVVTDRVTHVAVPQRLTLRRVHLEPHSLLPLACGGLLHEMEPVKKPEADGAWILTPW